MSLSERVRAVRVAIVAVALWLPVAACQQVPAPPPDGETRSLPPFAGHAWVSTDEEAAPGTLRVFLPDGTLIMDSCAEVYRLTSWRSTDPSGVTWDEDGASIDAAVLEATTDTLRLRLTLRGGETRDETYRLATVPFVCPDLPRQHASIGGALGDTIASCQ